MINTSELLSKISNRVLFNVIDRHKKNDSPKKLVYTSFDGDYMNFLTNMLKFTKNNGYLPVNPESTLGYYVSTITHGGSKVPVMKDCIKTELMCDEMWIFNPTSSHIPEGVLAEMIVWFQNKNTGVKVIPFFDSHKIVVDPCSRIETINYTEMSRNDILKYINSCSSDNVKQIKEKLLGSKKLPSSVYVVANFYNYKHIDWARAYCYSNGLCPVSPQNILPYTLYLDVSNAFVDSYMEDRLELVDRCEKMLWFTNMNNIDFEINSLDPFSCTELYYYLSKHDDSLLSIVDWKDAGVPKYVNPQKWALTTAEQNEVLGSEKNKFEIAQSNILKYEVEISDDFNIFKGSLLGDKERNFIQNDANAFLFGLISDQSVRAELAWSLPYNLSLRLGEFNIKQIANMEVSDLESVLKTKPALHRYPSNIAKYLKAAANMILDKYSGQASNIWNNGATAAEIVARLEEFKGISHKKAALGTLLLVRDLDVEIKDKYNINLAYDIHIRRICVRTGFAAEDSLEEIINVGREIFPEFPGRLTSSFWAIGRDICRPISPECSRCPLDSVCEHHLELGGDIHA